MASGIMPVQRDGPPRRGHPSWDASTNGPRQTTHRFSLKDAPRGYDMFKHKTDGCVRAVFAP